MNQEDLQIRLKVEEMIHYGYDHTDRCDGDSHWNHALCSGAEFC